MIAKSRSRKSRVSGYKRKTPPAEPLDKKDEVWCYVLVKLFTAMLEDPEEAKRLMKPSKSAFDVDLEPAVQQLRAAINRKKSEHFSVKTIPKKSTSAVSSFTADSSSYDATSSSRPTSSGSSSSSSSSAIAVDLKTVFKALNQAKKSKSSTSRAPSRTISKANQLSGREERSRVLSALLNTFSVQRG